VVDLHHRHLVMGEIGPMYERQNEDVGGGGGRGGV
jgi:hypothetical protein